MVCFRRPSGLPLDDQAAHDLGKVQEASEATKNVVDAVETEVRSVQKQ